MRALGIGAAVGAGVIVVLRAPETSVPPIVELLCILLLGIAAISVKLHDAGVVLELRHDRAAPGDRHARSDPIP